MQSSSVSRIKQTTQRGFYASLLIAALALGVSGPAQAALLNLIPETPDIASSFLDISYNAATNILEAQGFASSLDDGVGGGGAIVGGTFNLNAEIDAGGNLLGGIIIIGGTVGAANSGTLLTGNLTDIGFSEVVGVSDPLEFLFEVTGGDLAGAYGGTGGTILTGTDFAGWLGNFANAPFSGASDTFAVSPSPVPVPATVWLFGTALIGFVGMSRRRKVA
jgi:hypothetical protein